MPKHEPMTAKAIGKKIKSKGLQKLKFFCQMCQKQCRDANGFKCHTSSEAHQRQLLLFAENPHKYLGEYSGEFLKDFLYLLRTRFGTRRVPANQVYQEYIKDRDHVHMNSTRWVTLTGLCKWMGRKGICEVEENEKGWFITYIDRDPETLKKKENISKKEKLEKDYDERIAKIIEDQVERGKMNQAEEPSETEGAPKELVRNEEEKITFALPAMKIKNVTLIKPRIEEDEPKAGTSRSHEREASPTFSYKSCRSDKSVKRRPTESKKSTLGELMEEEEKFKAKKNKRDHWLMPDIIVKVLAKNLGEKYFKKKARVVEVINKYEGVVEMLDSGDKLKLDQEHLETVIPNVGRRVKILNGAYVGQEATLVDVNFDKYCCGIRIETGPFRGRQLDKIKYEDISKCTWFSFDPQPFLHHKICSSV